MRSMQYWEPTSDDEFLNHIKRMEKAPTMHPDIPLYPNVYSVFKNKASFEKHESSLNRQKNLATESQKKVQFAESKGTAEFNKNEVKNIDTLADGYINQKHRNFELHKWRTFKVSC
ncbi:hypothetical protein A4A49_06395 [Nicotiana attenuata]|uniref:Uncharacterized protein n=1 Tax=Nicotiana attenuata TaxID=49451 RepID=A0A1J6IJD9_NICAT|nr:hypothetical protein A4A49_06395 [Nicotiana attenuata]